MNSYLERPTDTHQDFDEVASQVPRAVLCSGLAEAFRSDRTRAFGEMASSLFGRSNPEQGAGLLAQLASAAGLPLLVSIAGGALVRFMQGRTAAAAPQAPAADVAQIGEAQVNQIATAAQQSDPGVLDSVGSYYAQHPQTVKVLDGSALVIAVGQTAQKMKT